MQLPYTAAGSEDGSQHPPLANKRDVQYHFLVSHIVFGEASAALVFFWKHRQHQERRRATFQKGYPDRTTGIGKRRADAEWDKALSEELKITAGDFWNIQEKLATRIQKIQLVPFSAYKTQAKNAHSANVAKSDIRAQWAEDALPGLSAYDLFIADKAAQQTRIVFSAENSVKNFKVLALSIKDVDENGKAAFAVKELFTRDSLTPARPLVVGMTFYGDTPQRC